MKNIVLKEKGIKQGDIVEILIPRDGCLISEVSQGDTVENLILPDCRLISKISVVKEGSVVFKGLMSKNIKNEWEPDETCFEFSNNYLINKTSIKKIEKTKKSLRDINMDKVVKDTTVRLKKEFYNYLGLENGLYKFKKIKSYLEELFFNEDMLKEDNISIVVL